MLTRANLRLAFMIVAVLTIVIPADVRAQTPANCPTNVNPGWIGYPGNVMDFTDGLKAGRFTVWALVNRTGIPDDLMSYSTDPGVPWDVNFASKEWYMAAVTAQCTSYVVNGTTWTIVQERHKSGYIGYDDQIACNGTGDDIREAAFDPYGSTDGDGGCGSTGSGGGGAGTNCRSEIIVVEASYDGGDSWTTLYEGAAVTCN